MSLAGQTTALFYREILQERRQKYAFFGVLLFLISTLFICKFGFKVISDRPVWNSLFWIILLFAAVTGVARSFGQESKGRLLYLYTLADPRAILLSKLAYNALLMVALAFTGMLFYIFLIGYPQEDPVHNLAAPNTPLLMSSVLLGSIGLASGFTMISAIASKAGNNFTLMAILGFPVILPLLLSAIRVSKNAIDGLGWNMSMNYLGVLAIMNVLIVALAYLLFPYLWRD